MRLTLILASAAVFPGVPGPAVAGGQSTLPSTGGEAGAATPGEATLRGTLVWEAEGQAPGDFFGVALAPAGDVNADGFPDLVVGAYDYVQDFQAFYEGRRETRPGYATVVSGSDGRVLHRLSDDDSDFAYGMAVGAAGDIDADGCADILVGAPNGKLFSLFGRERGRAYVYSGRTGALITLLSSKLGGADFGGSVGGLGDLDGDGHPEIGIGGQDDDVDRGVLIVYSSKEWKPRLTLEGGSWAFGGSFCAIDDINGDGVPDIAVGDRLADTPEDRDTGSVGLFCGSTGALLRSWHGPAKFASLGSAVAPACDLDGDGLRDLLVGAKGSETAGSNAGGRSSTPRRRAGPCCPSSARARAWRPGRTSRTSETSMATGSVSSPLPRTGRAATRPSPARRASTPAGPERSCSRRTGSRTPTSRVALAPGAISWSSDAGRWIPQGTRKRTP